MTEQVTRRGLENSVLKSEDVIFRGEMRQDGKWSEIRQWKTSNDSLRGLVTPWVTQSSQTAWLYKTSVLYYFPEGLLILLVLNFHVFSPICGVIYLFQVSNSGKSL